MSRKCVVTLTFMAEGESPQEVAQRALEAIRPMNVHPVVLCQIKPLDESGGVETPETAPDAASVFGRIMDAPTM